MGMGKTAVLLPLVAKSHLSPRAKLWPSQLIPVPRPIRAAGAELSGLGPGGSELRAAARVGPGSSSAQPPADKAGVGGPGRPTPRRTLISASASVPRSQQALAQPQLSSRPQQAPQTALFGRTATVGTVRPPMVGTVATMGTTNSIASAPMSYRPAVRPPAMSYRPPLGTVVVKKPGTLSGSSFLQTFSRASPARTSCVGMEQPRGHAVNILQQRHTPPPDPVLRSCPTPPQWPRLSSPRRSPVSPVAAASLLQLNSVEAVVAHNPLPKLEELELFEATIQGRLVESRALLPIVLVPNALFDVTLADMRKTLAETEGQV